MPETINGQLAMTNNGGEQSSFSTPFIEEFDSNVNRYYQYFELVVVNSDPGNVNDIEFTVHFKNKDYTELDNVFDLGTSFIFKPVDPDRFVFTVKYTNGENSSNTSFGYTGTEHISNNHVTVISFLMYPEKIGYRPGIQYDRIFDEDCEELLVFIDGVNTRASENFYLPFSILKNLAIGLDCNNPNISFQWNFDNTRFIYPDLAYQCYMELPVQNITSYKYFPLTRLNFKDEFITEEDGNYFYKDIHNFRVLPYFNYTDNGEKVFRFEAILNSIDKDAIAEDSDYLFETSYDSLNLFRIILAPVNKNHNYYYNDTYRDNEIEYDDAGLLDDRKGIQFSCSTDASMARVGLGMRNIGGANMTSISTPYNNKPLIFSLIYYPDREQYFGTVLEYNGESVIETSKEVSEYTTPNFIPYMNNIIIQHTKYADVDINLGTKPFIVHFTKSDETKNDLYVSPYNTYWKSLFPYTRMQFLNNHYQFSSPLLDNLLVLPYDLSNQNNNMYVEIKFYYENQSTINIPFALIGSGLKLSDSTLEDSQESQYDLSTFTGIVLRSPIGNKALLNVYIYKNGAISQTLWEDLNFSFDSESPVVAFKYLNGDDYFRIITTDTQNYVEVKVYKDITDMEILDALKYVVIGQEINNTNGIYRPIGINFGPDNLHFEDEVQDLWDQDQYDKEFNMDIITGGSVDYEQGELSDDNGDRDIDGTLLIEALRPEDNQDIADDYIINGIIEGYISEFNILSGSMDPNRFELTIGTNDEQLSINETIHIDTELDFISTLFKNQDDTFTGTATVTIEYSSGSGFNITGTTVTATYTGKDDNTLHFDMLFNIQAPPNDITPGESHFGITIILDDGVNDPVSYTIGDITVIVKAINYYKQNKAQLHQFISLSGGGYRA